MQLLLCAGKVNGFYKLLLHLFLLYLKLLVLGRTDLPGQLHNIETAASSGSVKLFVRVLWGLPTLPLRSSQVRRGRRILCSSGLKICVLCRYYPCWTSYGLFHSIQVLPWQSTLSNQNTHDTYSAASGFLMFFPGQCIFWRSPDFISKKPTQVPERVQSLPGVSSQNPIAITCKGEGIWWQSGLAQSWWWCFFGKPLWKCVSLLCIQKFVCTSGCYDSLCLLHEVTCSRELLGGAVDSLVTSEMAQTQQRKQGTVRNSRRALFHLRVIWTHVP